jgi:hypothetical protein
MLKAGGTLVVHLLILLYAMSRIYNYRAKFYGFILA